ncbi:MAG: hypothetical protein ACRD4B_02710, partial [Acidobacteriota bacterium]
KHSMTDCRIFILSPASSNGRRADILLNSNARFDLAIRFHTTGAPIGEVFSFLSGLYFRGKLAYAKHFARGPEGIDTVLIITANRGLIHPDTFITPADLRSFGGVPIDASEKRYVEPLTATAGRLFRQLPSSTEVVLLGSVGTKKYATPLLEIFNSQLKFPRDFVGRGDMSRGGLMLRSIDEQRELDYAPLDGAVVHGKRPPKLEKRLRLSNRTAL